jgi:hypothetical protein
VVDSDRDLADLCRRMRETGRSSCSVLFCAGDVFVEQPPTGSSSPPALRHGNSGVSGEG